jgi:hypothetical protein
MRKGPFNRMSDRELDRWIGEWEAQAPENFWMDGELRMSRRAAYKFYRQRWRRLSVAGQQAMLDDLRRGSYYGFGQEIHPEYTAIGRGGKPSRPARYLVERWLEERGIQPGRISILDYGCGRGDDTLWFLSLGYKAHGYDQLPSTPEPVPYCTAKKPRKKYTIVFSNYVINVIPTLEGRMAFFKSAWDRVRRGGLLYVTSRPIKDVEAGAKKGKWKRHGDGWLAPGRKKNTFTFQKGYSNEELIEMASMLPGVAWVEKFAGSGWSGVMVAKRKRG